MVANVVIDQSYYDNGQCDFEDLRQAAQALGSATEKDFKQIKNERWFTRVFDLVTLSNKKDIRMAKQITNVAQAQEILMGVLVRLSQRDKEIDELVTEVFSTMERLSQNDVMLAKRLKQLEQQYILGIRSKLSVDDFNEVERTLVGALLLQMSKCYPYSSQAQQQYANTLLTYLDITAVPMNTVKAIQQIENVEKKKMLLQICFEYAFLENSSFQMPDQIAELVEAFDFGNITIRETQQAVQSIYHLRGADGFTDRYYLEPIQDVFMLEMDISEQTEQVTELEPLHVSSITHVRQGEQRVYEYKNVHISAFIHVEGELIFKNCVVNYAESTATDEITLNEGASLRFINCEIICHGADSRFFIEGKGANDITIQSCTLKDCGYFLSVNDSYSVQIANSYLTHPKQNVMQSYVGWDQTGVVSISQSKIEIINENEYKDSIFKLDGALVIDNCVVNGNKEQLLKKEDSSSEPSVFTFIGGSSPAIFTSSSIQVTSSEFFDVGNIFCGTLTMNECEFHNCREISQTRNSGDSNLSNNLFIGCEKIFIGNNYDISNSQFKDCLNHIFEGSSSRFEFCEFYNVKNTLDHFTGENSNFLFMCYKDTTTSYISKCIFEGVEIEKGFLIAGNTIEKIKSTKVEVQDCEFRNCSTKRPTGKIIKEYSSYFGLFDRIVETKPLSYSNCIGLDNVNKEASTAGNINLRTQTSKGRKIGLAAAGIVAVAGSPITLAVGVGFGVSKLLRDDVLKEE